MLILMPFLASCVVASWIGVIWLRGGSRAVRRRGRAIVGWGAALLAASLLLGYLSEAAAPLSRVAFAIPPLGVASVATLAAGILYRHDGRIGLAVVGLIALAALAAFGAAAMLLWLP